MIGKGGVGRKDKETRGDKGEIDLRTPEQKQRETTLASGKAVSPARMKEEVKILVEKLRQPRRQTERTLEVESKAPGGDVRIDSPLKDPRLKLRIDEKFDASKEKPVSTELPVIDFGKAPRDKSGLPVIEADAPARVLPTAPGTRLAPLETAKAETPVKPAPKQAEVAPVEVKVDPILETAPKAERVTTQAESRQIAEVGEKFERTARRKAKTSGSWSGT